jgi:site-specific DNA-cytosine methylase
MMKVLVACEFSGVVRDAFIARGHKAISCDLLDSETPGGRIGLHYKGDVRDLDLSQYDLMVAHPPCTHLAVSGARYFKNKAKEQAEALDFIRFLLNAPVPRIALENPVSIISSRIRKPDQIIQPWMFGHPEAKKTCLWLKGLPLLKPTNILPPRGDNPNRGWDNQTPSGQNKLGPSPTRAKERSVTYRGIAEAMAEQWGSPSSTAPGIYQDYLDL